MRDLLLEIAERPLLRRLIKGLSLPLPLPQSLRRGRGAYVERPLTDQRVAVSVHDESIGNVLARGLAEAGAQCLVSGPIETFSAAGEAWGRPPQLLDLDDKSLAPVHALVFDASGISAAGELVALHDFFSPLLPRLRTCGRVVVLGRPAWEQTSFEQASVQRALEGFVRSVAKEIGRRGSTAQLIQVEEGAEDRLAACLRFVLSARSAYITGQPILLSAAVRAPAARPWVFPLEGRTALVTGAARGIGAAIARRLATEGAQVVCLDRPSEDGALSRLAREIKGRVLTVDLTDADAPERVVAQLGEGVDIVVHNAGITRDKTLARMRRELWEQVLDVNLAAIHRLTRALLGGPLRDDGRIICLSSIAGIAGNAGQSNYGCAKAGVIGFVEHLGEQLSARGISVNAVAPGFIETRMTSQMPVGIREVARRLNSLSQGGLPEDVAEAVCFLATPGACGMNSQVLRVCGGALIGA